VVDLIGSLGVDPVDTPAVDVGVALVFCLEGALDTRMGESCAEPSKRHDYAIGDQLSSDQPVARFSTRKRVVGGGTVRFSDLNCALVEEQHCLVHPFPPRAPYHFYHSFLCGFMARIDILEHRSYLSQGLWSDPCKFTPFSLYI